MPLGSVVSAWAEHTLHKTRRGIDIHKKLHNKTLSRTISYLRGAVGRTEEGCNVVKINEQQKYNTNLYFVLHLLWYVFPAGAAGEMFWQLWRGRRELARQRSGAPAAPLRGIVPVK